MIQSRTGNHDVRVLIRGFGVVVRDNAPMPLSREFRYIGSVPETEPDSRTAFDLIDISGASSIEVVRSINFNIMGVMHPVVLSISLPSQPKTTHSHAFKNTYRGSLDTKNKQYRHTRQYKTGKCLQLLTFSTSMDGEHTQEVRCFRQMQVYKLPSVITRLGIYLVGASNLFRIPGPLTQSQFDSAATQAQTGSGYDLINRDERRYNRLGKLVQP